MPEQNIGTNKTLATLLQVVLPVLSAAESLAPGFIIIIKDMLNTGKPVDQLLSEANAIATDVVNRAAAEQR